MTKEHARHVPIMGLCGPEAMVCMNCLSECNKTNGKGTRQHRSWSKSRSSKSGKCGGRVKEGSAQEETRSQHSQ